MDRFFPVFGIMKTVLCVLLFCHHIISAENIKIPECAPPDYPESGGYGPVRPVYVMGDIITYFCNPEAFISGNITRMCDFTGDWSGDTPFCDLPVPFKSSRLNMSLSGGGNYAILVNDSLRSTCLPLQSVSHNWTWTGELAQFRKVHTIRIFQKDFNRSKNRSLKVSIADIWLGDYTRCTEAHSSFIPPPGNIGWMDFNCHSDLHSYEVVIEEMRLYPFPWHLCEIYVLGEPFVYCTDPHWHIANGRLEISRTKATLVCNAGYIKSRETQIECLSTGNDRNPGVWTRKQLYCSVLAEKKLKSSKEAS